MVTTIAFTDASKPPSKDRTIDRHRTGYMREYEERRPSRPNRPHKRKRAPRHYKTRPRPWVAYDGEGVTDKDGTHRYTLLSAYQAGRIDDEVTDENGLSTVACLKFLCDMAAKSRRASIHIIYGGSYDCNMILRELPREILAWLYHGKKILWDDYTVEYRQGKTLWVQRISDGQSILLYDVVSFFQTSFVKACDSYLGTDWPGREVIVEMKAKRGTFTDSDNESVRYYNRLELQNLIALMDILREHFLTAGLELSRWDGPGAASAKLLSNYNIAEAEKVTPSYLLDPVRIAYAGGRFELLRFGHYPHTVYEYDLNSAYPSALLNVPNLSTGTWVRHSPGNPIASFGVYKVRWKGDNGFEPAPLWQRGKTGSIVYSTTGVGWYWSPEVNTALEWAAKDNGEVTILDGYDYLDDGTRPFAFIADAYRQRQEWKAAGDAAHVALKLALNSIYGKLCQQIGWKIAAHSGKIVLPPWHQLEWAGYATSYCRAKVFQASMQNPDAIIAFETDALFSTAPLDLPLSTNLGEWELTELDNITYLASGLYFSEGIDKTRGVDSGSINRAQVLEAMRTYKEGNTVEAVMTRFYTMGLAISQDFNKWRTWRTEPRQLALVPGGDSKRVHWCGKECTTPDSGLLATALHYTQPNYHHITDESLPYPLEWLDDERCADMEEYEELRYKEKEYANG